MKHPGLTLGLLGFGGLAGASTMYPGLDHTLTLALVGGMGATVAGGVVWWLAGDVAEWWENTRSNPPTPDKEPWYWPGSAKDFAQRGELEDESSEGAA